MKANTYFLLAFVGLAITLLIVVTNQQREGFRMPQMLDPCILQLAGLNQRITNLENRANDAQDNANTGVGQIQMVTAS